MFCEHCGAQLRDDAKFCEKCGNPVNQGEGTVDQENAGAAEERPEASQAAQAAQAQPQPGESQAAQTAANVSAAAQKGMENAKESLDKGVSKFKALPKKTQYIIGGAVIVVILLLIFALTRKTTIDLNQYVTISSSGYNGYGTAYVEFDTEAFASDNKNKIELKKEYMEGFEEEMSMLEGLDMNIASIVADSLLDGDLDVSSGLSNGDVVTFTWSFDEEELNEVFDCNFKFSDITYTVEGLEEVGTFDAFEGVEVVFTGMAPYGRAELQINSSDEKIRYLSYELSQYEDLDNGDTVEVSISNFYAESFAEQYGMVPAEMTKTYTVEGLGSYMTSMEQIPAELMESMKAQSEDVLRAHAAGDWDEEVTLSGLNYLGNYFLTPKSGVDTGVANRIYMVYEMSADINLEEYGVHTFTFYTYVSYDDLVLMEDGTGSVDLSSYERCRNQVNTDSYQTGENSWNTRTYYFYGYSDLDSMFNQCVTAQIADYSYETSVEAPAADEAADPAAEGTEEPAAEEPAEGAEAEDSGNAA